MTLIVIFHMKVKILFSELLIEYSVPKKNAHTSRLVVIDVLVDPPVAPILTQFYSMRSRVF